MLSLPLPLPLAMMSTLMLSAWGCLSPGVPVAAGRDRRRSLLGRQAWRRSSLVE